MSWKANRIAELVGHCIELRIECACTKVVTAPPEYALNRIGPDATIEDAERRMKCRACGQRPTIWLKLEWGVSGGRDRRVDAAPLPEWVRGALADARS